jgi:hypothetical protein
MGSGRWLVPVSHTRNSRDLVVQRILMDGSSGQVVRLQAQEQSRQPDLADLKALREKNNSKTPIARMPTT